MPLKKLPGVNSFTRTLIITDGRFFCLNANEVETDLPVLRHGIRGTQNINKAGDYEVSNVQVTETARTASDSTAFGVEYSLRFLPLQTSLFSCVGTDAEKLRNAFNTFAHSAAGSDGLKEVALRFARNVLNGRWLWRNRSLGASIKISVTGDDIEIQSYDALSSSLNHFNDYSQEEKRLGEVIAGCLAGERVTGLKVRAIVELGFTGSVEVFPSQNYVERKPKGFARPLYKIGHADPVKQDRNEGLIGYNDVRKTGVAALRDQKIGSALRTIDTWYSKVEENHGKPIAVEPVGANLELMTFFRSKKDKNTAFDIALRMDELDPNSEEGMFMIASLMRGGVYGESDKAS